MKIAFDTKNNSILVKGEVDTKKLARFIPEGYEFKLEPIGTKIYVVRQEGGTHLGYNLNIPFYEV